MDSIARVRRFNRIVTAEVGALDTSFLSRGRPLGAARVLNAIGRGIADVAAIRDELRLDSGLLSRLLRALESEHLIELAPSPQDGRRRTASLTQAGRAEFEAYEHLSNQRATTLLSGARDASPLLDAMDTVAIALGRDRIQIADADPLSWQATSCLADYYGELNARFAAGFDVEKSRAPDPKRLSRPNGAFLIASLDDIPVGCVIVQALDREAGVAEVKRLWVSTTARRQGLAKALMDAAEQAAREMGFRTLRLDTNSALPEAAALYRRTGWTEIEPFNDDPYAEVFFEKKLSAV